MFLKSFEFNGKTLEEFNSCVGLIDEGDSMEMSVSSPLSLNTVKINQKYGLAESFYEEAVSGTVSFIRDNCSMKTEFYPESEVKEILSWLKGNRGYKKFVPILDDSAFEGLHLYIMVKSVVPKRINGKVVGFTFDFEANTPYGLLSPVITTKTFASSGDYLYIINQSMDEGYLYPEVTFTCAEAGNLVIRNSLCSKDTIIKNCKSGEIIRFSGDTKIIESVNNTHPKLYNDFNFVYPRLCHTSDTNLNKITTGLKGELVVTYAPMIHLGVIN